MRTIYDIVARVADSLDALGRETPALSPQVQEMLGRAMNQMSRSGREMSQGNRSGGEQAGQAAGSALTEAINALRDDTARVLSVDAGLALPLAGQRWWDDMTDSRVIDSREPIYGHFAGGRRRS